MLPLRDENPTQSPAILTWLIIAGCLLAYFVWQPGPFGDSSEDVEFNLENAAIPCEVVQGRPLDRQEVFETFDVRGAQNPESCDVDDGASPSFFPDKNVWLSVVTSMFLHGSLLHIAGNMLFLWVFGNNIEEAMGKVGFALFYLAGGIVSALAHAMVNLNSTVPLVGASGAIAAVMGAYLVLYPHAKVRTLIFMLFILVVNIRAMWLLGFWFVMQFFTDPNSGVAWIAHVAGFVFGVLVGLMVKAVRPPRQPVGPWSYDYR